LALASTLSALANMLLLLWFLRRKIGPFGGRGIVLSGAKALVASLPMTGAVYFICRFSDWSLNGHKIDKLLTLGSAITVGLLIYTGVARLLRSDEVLALTDIISKKIRRKRV
jgi:putative peptidoglycan lipid II flippase